MNTDNRDKEKNVEKLALLNKLSDYEDVSEKVICKLTALTDIFHFFEYTNGKTNFRIKTNPGIFYILDDCIDDLEKLKRKKYITYKRSTQSRLKGELNEC